MIKSFRVNSLKYFLLGLSVLLLMYPSFVWDRININTYISFGMLIFALGLEILDKKALIISPPLPLFLLFFYTVYINIVGKSIGGTIFDSRIIVSLILFLFSKETLYNAYLVFVNIFGGLLILSLLFYILYISGIHIPNFVQINGPDGRDYYNYPFNTMLTYMKHTGSFPLSFYRFSAFVGEPGWIGTRAALILLSLKFQFRKYKILYIFLIAALLSFSLGAYIPLILSLIYFIIKRKVKINIKWSIVFILGVLTLTSTLNFDLFSRYIFSRLAFEDGTIAGDNRTGTAFNENWKVFITTPEVFIGKGVGQSSIDGGGAGWKTLVYNSGVFGMFIYISIFISILFYVWRKGDRSFAFFFLFVFLLTIYHRTRLHQIFYLIIILGGLLHNEKNIIKNL